MFIYLYTFKFGVVNRLVRIMQPVYIIEIYEH
jgi:hypothetical protein